MFSFWGRKFSELGRQTKLVRVSGFIFRIKKLDPFAYLDGSNSILQLYRTYEEKREMKDADQQKIKLHFIDVFMNSVVEPKLCRKADEQDGKSIWVENLFTDWDLVNGLYEKVMEYTYGKKKL